MSKGHCFACGAWIHRLDGMLISLCPACDKEAHGDDAALENTYAPRKAVQITTCYVESSDRQHAPVFITTVIADDGTIWEAEGAGPWKPLPPLPQGTVAGGGE